MTSRVEFCQEFHRIGSCIWSLISTGPKTWGLGYAAAAAAECGSASEPFIYLERGFIPLFQDILAVVPLLRNSVCATDSPGPMGFFFRPHKWKYYLALGSLEMENSLGSGVFPSRHPTCLSHPVCPHKPGVQNSTELLPGVSPRATRRKRIHKSFPTLFFFSSREIKADKKFLPQIAAPGKIQLKALQGPCGESKEFPRISYIPQSHFFHKSMMHFLPHPQNAQVSISQNSGQDLQPS